MRVASPLRAPLTLGIDPWERSPSVAGYDGDNLDWWAKLDHDTILAGCRATLAQLSLQDRCHLIRATSAQALSLIARLAPLDLLHIDGNHSETAALFDVTHYVPLVRPGGVVLFDDLGWSTTKPAQTHLATLCRSLEIVDGCGVFERLA